MNNIIYSLNHEETKFSMQLSDGDFFFPFIMFTEQFSDVDRQSLGTEQRSASLF